VTPERAAVAVSLRRRHRRRHGAKSRAAAAAAAAVESTTQTSRPVTTATPTSAGGHPPVCFSPAHTHTEHPRHSTSEQLQGASQQPQMPLEQSAELPHHPQSQPQQQPARRPDFLRMPSHDSVGYASIVSVLSWSSLPTSSVNLGAACTSPPNRKPSSVSSQGGGGAQDSQDTDSVTTTKYLVLPLELISISPGSRRASSASAYMQDFCCVSSEELVPDQLVSDQLVLEPQRRPAVSAVERVRGTMLRSESLGTSETHHPVSAAGASSRHWSFSRRCSKPLVVC